MKRKISMLAAATLVSGCATTQEAPEPQPMAAEKPADTAEAANEVVNNEGDGFEVRERYMAATEAVSKDLATLTELQVFEVGHLLNDGSENAFHCYGPCPEDGEAVDAFVQRADALHDLVESATKTVPAAPAGAECDLETVESQLEALRALEIVTVGAFLKAEPASNPNCYNTPCEEDKVAAAVTTCTRAAHLNELVKAVQTP